ncbi:hypothetical protein [Rhodocyclus tenuis]|uniref:Uncharacterized protein n=1 Tax=Rhodocyclus tenuis TaxID=1066 RepID=A0A840FXS0_RHOTE|nr:hypothetical protein [Rhodocyclus tenuis]MBB4246917.1 hypothetical protein [Rhodocyclus tenuis]
MKFALSDLRAVQGSLLASVLMIAIGAACVIGARDRAMNAERDERAAAAERSSFEQKLQRVSEEEKEIKLKSSLFGELQRRGVIGEEQRLEWVELLRDIRDTHRLIDLQYEISPQRPLESDSRNGDANSAGDAAGFRFYVSSMKLQLKLLHEEDLIRLVEELQQRAKALIQVKSCGVTRLPRSGIERAGSAAQLQAECQIDWITVRTSATP